MADTSLPTTHILTLKTDDKKEAVKKLVEEQGGTVTDSHGALGGLLSVHLPKDKVSTFGSHPDVEAVEAADKEFKTQ